VSPTEKPALSTDALRDSSLNAACDELEELGPRAEATPTDGGWNIEIFGADGNLHGAFHQEGRIREFPGHAAGMRLIDSGWSIRSCAVFATDRTSAGWKADPDLPGTWTAPIIREQDEELIAPRFTPADERPPTPDGRTHIANGWINRHGTVRQRCAWCGTLLVEGPTDTAPTVTTGTTVGDFKIHPRCFPTDDE